MQLATLARQCDPTGKRDALREEMRQSSELDPRFLLHTSRGAFDCEHVSLFSLATFRELSKEVGLPLDRVMAKGTIRVGDPVYLEG